MNRGLSFGVFLRLTGPVIPDFVAIILPITTFVVVQFVYQRLSGDHELTLTLSTIHARKSGMQDTHLDPGLGNGQPATHHLAYIDCARGYAVLMVLASHLTYQFANLPYPIKRLTTTGWFGVQLFFLASCLTLLMSWQSEVRRTGRVNRRAFFMRRFFRIAPAYYAAGLFYFFVSPPSGGFDILQAASYAAFVNAWHLVTAPAVADAWPVVPGGWSISVEFTFYACFPLFAAFVTSLRRALILFAASVAVGLLINLAAAGPIAGAYSSQVASIFLFYWFPNQASVFALGGVLFFAVQGHAGHRMRHGGLLATASIAAFCLLAYVPLGHYLGDTPIIPSGLAVCLPLMGFLFALSGGRTFYVNRTIASFGQVSFSAYLLHFAILTLFQKFPEALHTKATGYAAILAYIYGFALASLLTYAAAWLSHRMIEQPMVSVGKQLIA